MTRIRCFDFPKIWTMSRIIRVLIQNSLHQTKDRKEVKNREIRYLVVFCFGANNFELLPYLSYSSFIFWGSRNTLLIVLFPSPRSDSGRHPHPHKHDARGRHPPPHHRRHPLRRQASRQRGCGWGRGTLHQAHRPSLAHRSTAQHYRCHCWSEADQNSTARTALWTCTSFYILARWSPTTGTPHGRAVVQLPQRHFTTRSSSQSRW